VVFSQHTFAVRRSEFLARREEARTQAELTRLASTDPLTGVFNRRRLLELANDAFFRYRRYQRPFSILVMDLDGFKMVNDTFGHQQGDVILIDFARSVTLEKREADALGRMGGDEFCLVLPETAPGSAVVLAERLLARCGDIRLSDSIHEVHVTVSIGITDARMEDTALDALFSRADTALYQAKHDGRNRYHVV
jgi:diguanylate cyclase (GGDEF)-like protein